MGKKDLNDLFDRSKAKELEIKMLYSQYKKIINRICKNINKNIQENPLCPNYKISNDIYNKEELFAIKEIFSYLGYKIVYLDPNKQTSYTLTVSTAVFSDLDSNSFWISWGNK